MLTGPPLKFHGTRDILVTQRRSAEVSATQPRLTLTGFAKIFQSATDNFSLFSTELRNNQGVSCFVFR
jgi:hypothetical protein